jgi:D-sedoheptulose 7-phosphate isomerase
MTFLTPGTAVDEHFAAARTALTALELDSARLVQWARLLYDVVGSGGRVLVAGNGGSAAHAQHLTGELVGRFCRERRAFSAVCLTADTAAMTAIGNDYGFDEVFARQVDAHGRPGDALVLLTTSGRSPNLLEAAARARCRRVTALALTGPAPNPLALACDDAITVDAPSAASVQDAHHVAVHALCAAFDQFHFDLEERDGIDRRTR